MRKIAITTVPFAKISPEPIELLNKAGMKIKLNQGGKLDKFAIAEFVGDCDGAIVGTEDLSLVVASCPNLKILSKTGIGLDNIDFDALARRNIALAYTPDAPTYAVAELTVSAMINLSRKLFLANDLMKGGSWERLIGKDMRKSTLGIIGFGRVGKNVCRLLANFGVLKILVNDVRDIRDEILDYREQFGINIEFATKDSIYRFSDIISLHLPANLSSHKLLNAQVFDNLKKTVCIINTSRGSIVDEDALYDFLHANQLSTASLDVFATEPYVGGKLVQLKNVFMTSHMGSCSELARKHMELEASIAIVDFFAGRPLNNPASREDVC